MKKHTLIMLLCCLIPLAIFAVLWAMGFSSTYFILAVVLLCPLLHIFMMVKMSKKSGDSGGYSHH
ncbi:MAG: hypothetical protein A2144_11990 [Chloroflexi bacterium RBG_16_50_9]|nr:MAG: hypothetical protein A2144_11990 [Chloroflexi bacterium RBG_16_50_9]